MGIADFNKGVRFYRFDENKTRLIDAGMINKTEFISEKQLDVIDLVYYEQQKSILVLDEDEGVIGFQIKF